MRSFILIASKKRDFEMFLSSVYTLNELLTEALHGLLTVTHITRVTVIVFHVFDEFNESMLKVRRFTSLKELLHSIRMTHKRVVINILHINL